MAAVEESRPGRAMAIFAKLVEMGVDLEIGPHGQVAIACTEGQWPTVQKLLDHAPAALRNLVEEHLCEPWTGVDAPYVPDALRFDHPRKPSQMTWRNSRGKLRKMVHRKRRGRWEWQRVN